MSKTNALVFRFIVLASIALPALGQGTAAPSGTEDAVNRLVKAHQAWGPAASTPNTSLSLKEASREGSIIRIRMYATGLPKQGTYTLVSWPVTQRGPGESLRGVTFDESGLAVCAGTPGTCGSPDKPNDPIDLALRPVPGEPVRLGLVSMEGSIKVFAKFVPLLLKGEDKGCSVEAVLLTPGAELVEIEGAGFPANADIAMDSDSEGERHNGKGKTDSNGAYTSAILPYKQGVTHGTAKVSLKSMGCSPSVSVPWGKRN